MQDHDGLRPASRKRQSRFDQPAALGSGKVPPRSRFDDLPEVKRPKFVPAQENANGALTVSEGIQPSADADNEPEISAAAENEARANVRPVDWRNRYLSDEELDRILPNEGYTIVPAPPSYVPIRTPAHKLMGPPQQCDGFLMPSESVGATETMARELEQTSVEGLGDLLFFKASDAEYFQKGLGYVDDDSLTLEELKERKILRLLLKVKNGVPKVRKQAMRQLVDGARDFGVAPLFEKILPLMMERYLDSQERHQLVKVIDRILFKLDDLVRPYTHKILVVTEPLLIDEDRFTRLEGRQVITNLAKAAGLANMIATMRPDIDHEDDHVRNTTARAFAVVSSALGIPALVPFIKAVCRSKKSWMARHTGLRMVQQIAILVGVAVLPHLPNLVEAVSFGLAPDEDQPRVRVMAAQAIAALAEASAPYGIEAFESVLEPLWAGVRRQRGRNLAPFLKAVGFLIPLMDADYAAYYTREMCPTLVREFESPDEDMKKTVLQVIRQVVSTNGVEPQFVRENILPRYFRYFIVRRMAMDRRTYRNVVETTVTLADRVGIAEILEPMALDLKDANESFRNMVGEIMTKVLNLESRDTFAISPGLEKQLIDGIVYAFHEQSESMASRDNVMLEAFSAIAGRLGFRTKPYLAQIVSTVLWRLNYKSAAVRLQAADLAGRLIPVMISCDEEPLVAKLGSALFEQLSEEFPETLGSIIGALASILRSTRDADLPTMTPPIRDLVPRMTPILRNRHEKVQEASIRLMSLVAERAPAAVSAREWMRICFELIELLKSHRRLVRLSAMNAFGFIAKAIGPQDVLAVLLTNLRVQDRQTRACCTVAIGIVAEACGPFTCIPSILTEYRVPELTVRNGCLKALAFVFEHIGSNAKHYIHSVVTCIEDALTDRDITHRTNAAFIVKHLACDTYAQNTEDANTHLLNLLWPNILETAPHVMSYILDAVDALRLALGPAVILNYTLQGLFHPARRVRDIYWQVYNQAYLASQDALVEYYPALDSLHPAYRRDELLSWL